MYQIIFIGFLSGSFTASSLGHQVQRDAASFFSSRARDGKHRRNQAGHFALGCDSCLPAVKLCLVGLRLQPDCLTLCLTASSRRAPPPLSRAKLRLFLSKVRDASRWLRGPRGEDWARHRGRHRARRAGGQEDTKLRALMSDDQVAHNFFCWFNCAMKSFFEGPLLILCHIFKRVDKYFVFKVHLAEFIHQNCFETSF